MKNKKKSKKQEKKVVRIRCGACGQVFIVDGPNCRKCGIPFALTEYEVLK